MWPAWVKEWKTARDNASIPPQPDNDGVTKIMRIQASSCRVYKMKAASSRLPSKQQLTHRMTWANKTLVLANHQEILVRKNIYAKI